MSTLRAYLLVLLIGLLVTGCRRSDIQTRVIRLPGVRSAAASNDVMRVIRRIRGVDVAMSSIDLEKGEMTVVYDTMTLALKNLEHAIAKAGYDANEITAYPNAGAGLPPR